NSAQGGCRSSSAGPARPGAPRPAPCLGAPRPAPCRTVPGRGTGGAGMDIDLSVLRGLESEKDISMDLAIKAIEDALLVAYHKYGDSAATAGIEVDRRTGHVTVWAAETGEDGQVLREYDHTPAGFGRIAATTARQVILQRLRDAEDELTFGEYAGREGDIV